MLTFRKLKHCLIIPRTAVCYDFCSYVIKNILFFLNLSAPVFIIWRFLLHHRTDVSMLEQIAVSDGMKANSRRNVTSKCCRLLHEKEESHAAARLRSPEARIPSRYEADLVSGSREQKNEAWRRIYFCPVEFSHVLWTSNAAKWNNYGEK